MSLAFITPDLKIHIKPQHVERLLYMALRRRMEDQKRKKQIKKVEHFQLILKSSTFNKTKIHSNLYLTLSTNISNIKNQVKLYNLLKVINKKMKTTF